MNENKLLLNYMYQEGFTEEDMYNKETIDRVQRSIMFCAYRVKLAIKAAAKKLTVIFMNIWERIKPFAIEAERINKEQQILATKKALPKPDFKAVSIMRSQVINRKPVHQVRKIIR